MKVSPKENASGNFYSTTRNIFLLSKFSGLLPINGLTANTSASPGFSWFYFMFISVPCILLQHAALIIFLYNCLQVDTLSKYPDMALWVYGEVGSILFLQLSINFKKMINDIQKIESSLPSVNNNKTISKKMFKISIYLIFSVIANFFLQEVTNTMFLNDCKESINNRQGNFKSFSDTIHLCLMKYFPFSFFALHLFQFIKLQASILWTLGDTLIISCCLYLENQFKQFNEFLFKKTTKEFPDGVNWNELQAHYTGLSDLVRTVDKYINPITFTTFFTDMILICQQLFLIIGNQSSSFEDPKLACLNKERNHQLSYYRIFISSGLMIVKAASVLYTSAQLHTTSRKSLEALGTMPRTIYTYETQRFMDQVYHSTVALSGFELFYFTKETILTVCSIMVTYELMLIQM